MAKIKKEKPIVAVSPPPEAFDGKKVHPYVSDEFGQMAKIESKPQFEITPEPKPQPQVIIISGGVHTPFTPPKIEGETFQERLLNFVSGKIDLPINDFLKAEFKDSLKLQTVNKQLKGKLQSLVSAKKISIKGNSHLKLGGFYYDDGDTKTKHYTARNTKIEVTAL